MLGSLFSLDTLFTSPSSKKPFLTFQNNLPTPNHILLLYCLPRSSTLRKMIMFPAVLSVSLTSPLGTIGAGALSILFPFIASV